MGTKFTMSQRVATGPHPTTRCPLTDPYYVNDGWSLSGIGSTLKDAIPNGTAIYPWHMYSDDTSTGLAVDGYGSYIWESSDKHGVWVKAWVSDALKPQEIAGTFDFYGIMVEPNTSSNAFPAMRMYLWKGDDSGIRGYLYDGTSSVEMEAVSGFPWVGKLFFDDTPISTITSSAGDRLVVELFHINSNSAYGNYTYNMYWQQFWSGNTCMYLSLSDTLEFLEPVGTSLGLKYDMEGHLTVATKMKYHIGQYLNKTCNLLWHLEGMFLQRDNDNPYRGEYAALIHPQNYLTTPPVTLTTSYEDRWYDDGRATLNKYYMIDDFEGAAGFSDWSYTTYSNKIMYYKTLSAAGVDLSNYQVLSFYGRGTVVNKLRIYFKDTSYRSTLPDTYVLSTMWERYERSIVTQTCDMTHVKLVYVEADYRGDMYLDDIAVLSTTTENADYVKLNVEQFTTKRPLRINTIKIPYREGELVQLSGEENAQGIITVRDLNVREKRFINDTYRASTPIYFRYRHQGIPMFVSNFQKEYTDIKRDREHSRDTIEFVEVYNAEL